MKESEPHVEPHKYEGPNVQVSQGNNNMHRTSLGNETLASDQTSGVNTSQHEARPLSMAYSTEQKLLILLTSCHCFFRTSLTISFFLALGDERSQLFQADSNNSFLDKKRWNMEFKDATSAAQAAAESAELASMAARAAAELSSRGRISRQHSTESHNSDFHVLKDGEPERYTNSRSGSGQFSEDMGNRSSYERNRPLNEQIDEMKPNNIETNERFREDPSRSKKEYSQSASLKSKASNDDGGYSRKNSLKEVSRGEMNVQGQNFKYKAENENGWPQISKNVREDRIEKQPRVVSSNSDDQKFEHDDHKKPFLDFGKADIYGEASQTSSPETAAVVFDKSDPDSDIDRFDMGTTFDEQEPRLHLPIPGQKSREHLSMSTDSWSPRSSRSKIVDSTSSSLFHTSKNSSENSRSIDGSKLDNSTPVAFDESDGPSSESEEDNNMSRHSGFPRDLPSKHNQSVGSQFKDKSNQSAGSPLKEKGSSRSNRKQPSLSSDDELDYVGMNREGHKGKRIEKPPTDKPAFESKKSTMELNHTSNSSSDSEDGLNFDNLRGGFRHKGYNHPPYLKNRLDESVSLKKESEKKTTATVTRPSVESPKLRTVVEHKKSSRTAHLQSESDSDSDSSEEEEYLRKNSGRKKEVRTKPSVAASNLIFGSDRSDLDEDVPKVFPTRISHQRSGISRRTKGSTSGSHDRTYSNTQLSSEALNFDDEIDRKPTASNTGETRKRSDSHSNSSKLDNQKQSTSAKVDSAPARSNYWGPPEHLNPGKSTSATINEPKTRVYDSKVEKTPTNSYSNETQQSQSSKGSSSHLGNSEKSHSAKVASKPTDSSLSRTADKRSSEKVSSVAVQESKTKQEAALDKSSSSKDITPKASHVHPKLPDYDFLVQSLRKNRS